MKKLLIIGASGHGKVVANIAQDCGEWDVISFLDDDKEKIGRNLLNYNVINSIDKLSLYIEEYHFIIGIGNNNIRQKLTNQLKSLGAKFATLVHPTAVIGLDVLIEEGTVVMPLCVINASSHIGEGCIINTRATIDHDCKIESYVHLSPGVSCGGSVQIKSKTWLGVGVKVINNIYISSESVVGAGAVVIEDINTSGTYVGVPAKLKIEKVKK